MYNYKVSAWVYDDKATRDTHFKSHEVSIITARNLRSAKQQASRMYPYFSGGRWIQIMEWNTETNQADIPVNEFRKIPRGNHLTAPSLFVIPVDCEGNKLPVGEGIN